MDTPKDQNEHEQGNPQPSEIPVESDRPTSDLELPQQELGLKSGLTTERLQPILEKLTNLERDDPKLAFQTVRIVGLYRYTLASCASKPLDKQKLDHHGQAPREASVDLHDAKDGIQPCPDKQLSRFHLFERA
ncbi:unnamed protein product [Penicillium viridicatum]